MIVEVITYFPLIFLIILFRKTKPHHKRSKKIEKIFPNLNLDVDLKKNKTTQQNNEANKNKAFKFPWYFKIILYMISFLIMGISILFVLFKGNLTKINWKYVSFLTNLHFLGIELGDMQVRNWLISLIFTILTGIFITQPLQVCISSSFSKSLFLRSKS